MTGRDPMTKQRSKWERLEAWEAPGPPVPGTDALWWVRRVGDGHLVACVADEPEIGWHLSVSFRDHRGRLSRYPRWDEIAHARDELLPADRTFIMTLPPASEYVALHATTFHLHELGGRPPPKPSRTASRPSAHNSDYGRDDTETLKRQQNT